MKRSNEKETDKQNETPGAAHKKKRGCKVISPMGNEILFYDMTDYLEQLRHEKSENEMPEIPDV